MSQDQKANELVEKATKRLAAWSLFSSSSKYEDAVELLSKAANLYKASKKWDDAGKTFEEVARLHIKLDSAHEAATAYSDAANCYKKTDISKATMLYKEAVSIQIDLGRFSTAAKLQKEIGEMAETEGDLQTALEAFQTAADYYAGEESHSSANQCLLKVAAHASTLNNLKKAIEIYEQFGTTREGEFLRKLAGAFESLDPEAFTDAVKEFDEISRLDPQKTTLLLAAKTKIKDSQEDIT